MMKLKVQKVIKSTEMKHGFQTKTKTRQQLNINL